MSKVKKLLWCPFCGCPGEYVFRKRTKGNLPYAIACSSTIDKECLIYSGYEERHKHDKRSWDDVLCWYTKLDDAVKAWNTRRGELLVL